MGIINLAYGSHVLASIPSPLMTCPLCWKIYIFYIRCAVFHTPRSPHLHSICMSAFFWDRWSLEIWLLVHFQDGIIIFILMALYVGVQIWICTTMLLLLKVLCIKVHLYLIIFIYIAVSFAIALSSPLWMYLTRYWTDLDFFVPLNDHSMFMCA